jgi:lysophospholipase L1-like esterase
MMQYFFCSLLIALAMTAQTQVRYLALGDSYTIGESVSPDQNFPSQTVAMLRKEGYIIEEAEIIAKTGWTTFELRHRIDVDGPRFEHYDFVSLLIGVNNQYRGLSAEAYAADFEELLKIAIQYADDRWDRVVVLSIPDWGVTPFAANRDRQKIALEIDQFNAINRQIAGRYQVQYINITPGTREASTHGELLAQDGLHPSALEYNRWALLVAEWMQLVLAE